MSLKAQIAEDRAFLVRKFPGCFAPKGMPKRPLAVGIHAEMIRMGVLPTTKRIRAFLGDYTRGPAYHEALAAGGPRYDLAGEVRGQVDEASRHRAVTLLGQMRRAQDDAAELRAYREAARMTIRQPVVEEFEEYVAASGIDDRWAMFLQFYRNIKQVAADHSRDPHTGGASRPATRKVEEKPECGNDPDTVERGAPGLHPAPAPTNPWEKAGVVYCTKSDACGMVDGHPGDCLEVPF